MCSLLWKARRAFSITAVMALAAAASYAPTTVAAPLPALTCTPPAAEPEIAALARSLEYNLGLIYEYVYYNIDYSPTWGSKKGALGTYLDRRGNGIDQNTLFVELLRQSCVSANFRYGSVTVPTSAMANLLGVESSVAAVATALGNGGFSGNVDATNTTINTVWTEAVANGSRYELDPSFKSYAAYTPIDLGKAMGYSRSSFLSAVAGGAMPIPGIPAGVNSIKGLNRTQLTNQLNAYSGNLANYLKTNQPSSSSKQAYGGRDITNDYYGSTFPSTGTLYSSLPGSFETVYTVTVSNNADGSTPVLSSNVYASQIAGKRLTLTYNASSQPVLALDGVTLVTGAATASPVQTVSMTVQHPYPAGANFSTWTVRPQVQTGGTYALMLVAGELGRDTLTRHQKAVQRFTQTGQTGEAATGESLAAIGTAYLSQSDRATQFFGDYFGFVDVRHAAMGIAGKKTAAYVDFPAQTNSASPFKASMSVDDMLAAAIGINIFNSTLESTAVDQLQKNPAVSTVRMFDYANTDGTGFVEATNTNWNQVQNLLTNWSANDKAAMAAYLQANPANGQLFIPQNGARKVGSWTGSGYYQFNTAGNIFTMAYLISGGYYGGYSTQLNFNSLSSSQYSAPPTSQPAIPAPTSSEPIDMFTGAYLYDHQDIDVGTGVFPFNLAFKRSYNSDTINQPTELGNGWRHNYMMSATVDSDSYLAFGSDNPLSAVPSAVMAYVLKDLSTASAPNLTNTVVSSLAASWMMDQLVDNAVTLNLDRGSKKFVKIPTASGPYYIPPPGDASTITVDANTSAVTLTDKFKHVYAFNADGRIGSWSDTHGNAVRFTYAAGNGPLQAVSNNHGGSLSFSYSNGKLSAVSNGSHSVSYLYNGVTLRNFVDQAGNATKYDYAGDGYLVHIYYPSFPTTPAVVNYYNALGQVATQIDAYGNGWNYLIANGQRSEEVDPTGASWTLYYDKNGNNIETIDQVGNHTVFGYDGIGRRVSIQYPAGDGEVVTYDANSNILSKTTYPIPGATDTITGKPASPRVESWTYDTTFNKPLTEKNARGYLTTHTYDSTGNLITTTQPVVAKPGAPSSAPVTTMAYTYGLIKQVVDAEGRVTNYDYDAATLRLLSKTEDAGAGHLNLFTRYAYDAVGNSTSVIDPRGSVTITEYDALRHVTRVTPPAPFASSVTQYNYDADGHQIAEMHATGNAADPWRTISTRYDAAGKAIKISQPDGTSKTTTYDAVGRVATETSGSGRQVAYAYDPASRVVKITDQVADNLDSSISRNLGAITREQRTYYNTGGLATLTDGKGQTLTYYYDGFKRQKQIVYPDNRYELHGFDDADNELVTQNRSGQLIWYSYDPLNRMDGKQPDGQAQVTYGYDYTGRMLTASSSTGPNFTYGYDTAGRQLSETRADLGKTSWTLDADGNRNSLTWPGTPAYTTSMVYDAMNRLTDVYEGTVGGKRLGHYDYNVLAQRSASAAGPASTQWQWTNGGQIAQMAHTWNGGNVTLGYSYNSDHQRSGTTANDSSFLPAGLPTSSQSYTSNTLNQYTAINGAGLIYDTRGNLTNSAGWVYAYDTENHLVNASKIGTSASYSYDAQGRRSSKTVNGATTYYLSVGNQEIAEYDSNKTLQRRFVYGPGLDEPLAVIDASGNHQYVLTDALGSIVGMVNDSGSLTEKYAYTGYGSAVSGGANTMPYLFAGRRFDPETELYYNRARMYSPALGRFMQADPFGTRGGLNLYAYVQNDPLINADPLGLASLSVSAYLGFGGGVVIGRDNVTGEWFYGGRLGVGLGAGGSFDPLGSRPGAGQTSSSVGTTVGVYLSGGATVGPYGITPISGQAGVDLNSQEFYGSGPYPDSLTATVDQPTTFGLGFSVGIEVIGHSGGCAR